jgi:flavin reductase (DIM6/NTAB) family NADH-FMN oxidoreductase RutF
VSSEGTERAWALSDVHGSARVRECGFTLVPARAVRAPVVDECPANLECLLDDVKCYGEEVLIFGRVIAASIEERCVNAPFAAQYERLAPAFFLEAGAYAGLGQVKRVGPWTEPGD